MLPIGCLAGWMPCSLAVAVLGLMDPAGRPTGSGSDGRVPCQLGVRVCTQCIVSASKLGDHDGAPNHQITTDWGGGRGGCHAPCPPPLRTWLLPICACRGGCAWELTEGAVVGQWGVMWADGTLGAMRVSWVGWTPVGDPAMQSPRERIFWGR